MSDWGIDGVAGNTWSPLEEVAWIEVQSKTEICVAQSGISRSSSTDLFPNITDELAVHDQTTLDKDYNRHCNPEGVTFADRNTQESCYTAQRRKISSANGCWHDYGLEKSHTDLTSTELDKSVSFSKKVSGQRQISKYSFDGTDTCKGESSYDEDGPGIVKSSCHFLLSDMCPPGGDFECLAEVPEEVRKENLLEFGWGNSNNLEDIEKLFSSTNSILSHELDNTTGLLWEPPSPTLGDSIESVHQPVKMASSGGNPVPREVMKDFDGKGEAIRIESLPRQGASFLAEGWRSLSYNKPSVVPIYDAHLHVQANSCTDCGNGNQWESEGFSAEGNRGSNCLESESICTLKEVEKWKSIKGRRHGQSKRLDDNVKSTGSRQKGPPNLGCTNSSPLMYVPVVPIAHNSVPESAQVLWPTTCEPINPVQGLQPVPYVHAGFGFTTHHHLPVVVPTPSLGPQQLQPQGQPVFITYQPHFTDSSKLQPSKGSIDGLSQSLTQSLTSTSTMTPREKIEKLRWRQKMQARLAVEQQQQQLINQRLIPEQAQFGKGISSTSCEEGLSGSIILTQSTCDEPLKWNGRSLSVEGALMEDGDESLTASVLQQLLNIATKMDTRTRLCLRDGFCRLARNAMQRRAATHNRGLKRSNSEILQRACTADSSSSSEQSSSQRLLTVDDIVETETNPMDRFIAHLLFHKRLHSPCTTSDVNSTPCNNSETSQVDVLHQNGFARNESNQLSHLCTATRSSYVNGEVILLNGQHCIAEVPSSDCSEKPDLWLQQEKGLAINTLSADHTFQQSVKRESCVVDMESEVGSTGYLVFSDEVAEPLLPEK